MTNYFNNLLNNATTKQIGASLNVDVLKFKAKSMEAIVRVRERYVNGEFILLSEL